MAINYEQLIADLIKPLVMNPDDVMVKNFSEENDILTIQVIVNQEDLGRVIGKNGRIANAIRTIAYASASKEGKRVQINIDSL